MTREELTALIEHHAKTWRVLGSMTYVYEGPGSNVFKEARRAAAEYESQELVDKIRAALQDSYKRGLGNAARFSHDPEGSGPGAAA